MTYQDIVALVRAEKRPTAFYAMRCMWWTTNPKDLGELPDAELPCCPYCGSVLLQGDAEMFLRAAADDPQHYGAGGLATFAAAHHGSGLHSTTGWNFLGPAAIRFPQKPRVLSMERSIRCTRCGSEFSEAETEGANGCPKCGATGLPCAIKDDVTIRINWHELRILGIWADQYAAACNEREPAADARGTIAGILGRIQAQHPDRTPLTLLGELKQLQEAYPDIEATDGRGRKILEPKKPN